MQLSLNKNFERAYSLKQAFALQFKVLD